MGNGGYAGGGCLGGRHARTNRATRDLNWVGPPDK